MRIGRYEIRKPKIPKGKNKRVYEAADKGRRGKSFRLAGSSGANREVLAAIVTLRDRSRHLTRNNGWAARAVNAVTRNTIGDGIQPAPMGGLARTARIKALWKLWANTTACDWNGQTTFYGLQEQAMRAIVEGGEVLVLRRWVIPDNDCPVPVKLQLLEGDHLDHSRNETNDMGVVRMGVQFDKAKRRIGYWIYDDHPGDNIFFGSSYESKYIPKEDILHVYEILRVGQLRGLPFGVASFMKMADFSDYEDAQLVKQKIAACFAAFALGSEDDDTILEDDDEANSREPVERLEPGMIEYLKSTQSVEFANPPSVGEYTPYTARILQGIAVSYGITYEMLTADYSGVNFTSGRMAKIDVTNNFNSWQYKMMVPMFCTPIWNWFNDACIVAGLLNEKIFADWTAPRVQQLDPTKETDAQVKRIENGLSTWSEVIRETGRDPEEFMAEVSEDIDRWKTVGVDLYAKLKANDKKEWQSEKSEQPQSSGAAH